MSIRVTNMTGTVTVSKALDRPWHILLMTRVPGEAIWGTPSFNSRSSLIEMVDDQLTWHKRRPFELKGSMRNTSSRSSSYFVL